MRTARPGRFLRRVLAGAAVAALVAVGLVAAPSAGAAPAAEATTTVSVGDVDLTGGPVLRTVPVTVTNGSSKGLRALTVTFRGPVGWQVTPATRTVKDPVRPGKSATVVFTVRVPEQRPGFSLRTFTATATYQGADGLRGATGSRTVRSGEPLADLAAAYNATAITSEADPTAGNYDGEGNTFSAEKLADVGLGRGQSVTALGATLTMPDVDPGTPDNVSSGGQAVSLDGSGSRLVFLGSGVGSGAVGTATVYYTDGTSSSGPVGFPNWSFAAPTDHGATLVASSVGRNRPDGYGDAAYAYRVFANSVPLTADKTVDFVVLPSNGTVHVFDVAIAP